jgi:hypothetical protein
MTVSEHPTRPRDLAGRIRALVQEYAGRWADANDGESDEVLRSLVEHLVQAVSAARNGRPIALLIHAMRSTYARSSWAGRAFDGAADELEAIVRECGEAHR